jgi:regulatory protein
VKRAALSLQARAMVWLAQREQSRSELRRKLMRVARREVGPGGAQDAGESGAGLAQLLAEVEAVLDALEAGDLLSEQRFVDARLRSRQPRFGARRIQQELQQHGVQLRADQLQELRSSEWQRASQLWLRRFAQASSEPRERARQARFLVGRGFSAEVVHRVVAGQLAPMADGDD